MFNIEIYIYYNYLFILNKYYDKYLDFYKNRY